MRLLHYTNIYIAEPFIRVIKIEQHILMQNYIYKVNFKRRTRKV